MVVQMTASIPLGDGRVRVFTRTPLGHETSVVMGHDKLGTADMYAMLERQADMIDSHAGALDARIGKSDQDAA